MMPKIRIFVADDHAVLRAGLKAMLEAQPDMEVVGEAGDGQSALAQAEALRPDVMLADIGMPGLNGFELIRALKHSLPEARTIVLTVHEDESFLRRALRAGAVGYLVKRAAGTELLAAIRAVARGEAYLLPSLTKDLIEDYLLRTSRDHPTRTDDPDSIEPNVLSPREMEILELIAQGHNNLQIAERLIISVKTVESHCARIQEKLGIHGRVRLARYAIEKGLLPR
jgi:two-component system response regulator NreC